MTFSFISLLMVYPLTLLMPFNKHIYSISYLFLTLSICAVALSLFMALADILTKKKPDWQHKI
jgi:ABC-type transport system involved in cytochrome c biogenesis permease component